MKLQTTTLTLFLLFLLGCDRQCFRTVNEVINAKNSTNQNLNIEVCTTAFTKKEIIQVPIDTDGDLVIQEREVSYISSGRNSNKCPLPEGEAFDIEISLTSASFSQVKLCYKIENNKLFDFIFLKTSQSCPSSHVEQLEPNDDCFFSSLNR